jgi:hypothetical protein
MAGEAKIHPHTKELARVLRHIMTVQVLLRKVARLLLERADQHDLSKLAADELGGMIEIDRIADKKGLNSPEYMAALSGPAIQLHRSRHSHHPEYHADGVEDMSLLDLVEMVCDWKAANMLRGHPEWRESVEMMADRLDLPSCYVLMINLVAETLEG